MCMPYYLRWVLDQSLGLAANQDQAYCYYYVVPFTIHSFRVFFKLSFILRVHGRVLKLDGFYVFLYFLSITRKLRFTHTLTGRDIELAHLAAVYDGHTG